MAKHVLKDAFISVGGVDLSDHAESVSLPLEADAPESTAFGDNWRSRVGGGLKDWTIDVTWHQDFAASEVNATIWSVFEAGTAAIVVREFSDATSDTNPGWSGTTVVTQYNPVTGNVGDLAKNSTSWPGGGALSYTTG